jgi:hypothetical protein
MAWRIHFTAEDLERIQVSPTLGPLAETVIALELLACPLQPHAMSSETGPTCGMIPGRGERRSRHWWGGTGPRC